MTKIVSEQSTFLPRASAIFSLLENMEFIQQLFPDYARNSPRMATLLGNLVVVVRG
jgi:hypothetical protein